MFDLKKQIRWAQVKAGIIVTIALLILFFGVFFAGSIEKVLYPKVMIKAAMADVKGLKKGAPVWVYGIEEGSVDDISLDKEHGTMVTISVYRRVLDFLKKDATASVLTMGLLGDKYVELSPGSSAEALKAGDTIKGVVQVELKDMMEASGNSIQKINDFVEKLGRLVERIEKSEGTVARFLEDPGLYDNLKESTRNLSVITRDISTGKGTIGMLVKDHTVYDRLAASTASLELFSRRLEKGSGTVQKLMTDDLLYNRLVGAATTLEEFGAKANSPSGSMGRLLNDPSLYDNLNKTVLNLSSISERIDRGEGAAGALLRDEALVNDIKGTVQEMKNLMEDIRKEPRRYFKFSLF